jgi:hypothetical protein
VGPIYYSTLVVAETFGHSNTAQIVDLNANNGYEFTPAYAVYDGGALTKLVLFNYITDPTGESDYTVTVTIGNAGGSAMPASVQVKCVALSLCFMLEMRLHPSLRTDTSSLPPSRRK